jgi:hypothetical protein
MLSGAPASAVAAPSPAWSISQLSFPTVLVPGSSASVGTGNVNQALPQFTTSVTNIGGEETHGPVTITETLPPHVTADPSVAPERRESGGGSFKPCAPAVGQVVTCEFTKPVPSGELLVMTVPLQVEASIPLTPVVSQIEVSGGGASVASTSVATPVGTELPSFDFLGGSQGLAARATVESGLDATLAGSHPFAIIMESNFTAKAINGAAQTVEAVKNLHFQLPPGVVANPQGPSELCTETELISRAEGEGQGGCPPESQIGQVVVETYTVGIQPVSLSLYDMQPPPGVAAQFGFSLLGTIIHVQGGLDSSFHLTAASSDILAKVTVLGVTAQLWGNPADPRHDWARRGSGGCGAGGCSIEPTVPFLTMPTSCHEPLLLGSAATSWLGRDAIAGSAFFAAAGNPLEMEGCNAVAFEPTIESRATTNVADSPSGLDFTIHQPQNEAIDGRATAALKNVHVTLPEGMTVNAAGANGLGACSEQQMGYAPVEGKIQFDTKPQSCPNSAKVGTLSVNTPLLGHELPGSVFVAKPFANPFGSLLAIYLAVEDEESGIVAKLAGKVEPNPLTGQLTATFTENPQLPLEDIRVHFFNGPNAALKTPLTCGPNITAATLTPWSTPEGADAQVMDSFEVQTSPGPGPCPSSEAQAPNSPAFAAGTVTPLSGVFSPFVLRLGRADGTQRFAAIDTTLPEGLLGKAAGIPYCSEAAIALAKSREAPERGKEELASPSCPSASEVGTVQVTAGAGTAPLAVSGHAYLAGPYKGAPLSVVVIVPGVAGPFDLGNVVSRVALYVGQYDARIHAVSDPLPTIIDGIPLDVRSIELKLSRSNFTLNPTSCEAMAIEGSVSTPAGGTAPLKNRFQVGECGRLGFKPSVQLSLKGPTKRTGHPTLKAVVTYPKKGLYANIARAQVSLPHSEFLDQNNLNLVCKQADLTAGTCPKKAIYGKVKVWTPLLDKPLTGNVYLGVGFGYKLPALVAELNGQIRVLAKAKVDTDKQKGIRSTFEAVPDAPLEKFVLEMKGGKKYGLLENSENICKKTQKASAVFDAQNGKTVTLSPVITNSCKSKKHKGRHKGKKRR